MPADPNWLHSTTAQCAAAIVAIIGGFLVSRVVPIGSEKSALLRRRTELTETVERLRDDLNEVRKTIPLRNLRSLVGGLERAGNPACAPTLAACRAPCATTER